MLFPVHNDCNTIKKKKIEVTTIFHFTHLKNLTPPHKKKSDKYLMTNAIISDTHSGDEYTIRKIPKNTFVNM